MRLLAYVLTVVLLFQTLGQELLVLNYTVNKARITEQHCVNKARPRLHCDGKCYLAKQLRRSKDKESKAPGTTLAKLKLEAVVPLRICLRPLPPAYPQPARRYAAPAAPRYAAAELPGIFHPPAFRG